MTILTLNIIVNNKKQYIDDNKKVLDNLNKTENVKLVVAENKDSKYDLYSELLKDTDSVYVAFYNEWNKLDADLLKKLVKHLRVHDEPVITQSLSLQSAKGENEYLTGGMKTNALYFNRYIFKTELLKSIQIKENEIPYYQEKIILKTMRDMESIPLIAQIPLLTEEAMERNVNSYAKQFEKEWYIPFFEEFLFPYVKENKLSETEQRLIIYFILIRFYLNFNAKDKQVLQGKEVEEFFSLVQEVSNYIDDKYIIEIRERGILPKFFAYLMLKRKYGKLTFYIEKQGNNLFYSVNGMPYDLNCVQTRIVAINFENDKLIIDGEIVGDYCLDNVEKDFAVQLNGKNIPYKKTERYNLSKAFGQSIYRYYPFQFEVSMEELKNKNNIQFKIRVNKKWVKTAIQFDKISSRLIRSNWAYYRFADKMITFSKERLCILKATGMKTAVREFGLCLKRLKTEKSKIDAVKMIGLRSLYWVTKKRYSKKPIWIFYDKLYKAGDNAEYLFRYCMENHPEADCYYILNKNASEYKGLKKEYGKHIVVFESLRNKLAVLNAQYVFATHATVFGFCGFNKKLRDFFKNLLNADIVCIQHGLTIQNIAQYQNRLADNTKKYFCASKYEIDNLKRPVYGYDEESLCLTGCPRYDGLVNKDMKQILIAPTWRRNIVITGNKMGTAKSYNPDFKHTKYFEIYNSLINDERLIAVARKHGYKLVFLIHPTLSSQVEDYDTNEFLSIIPAVSDVSYEKMLTESSLMLTDYSGIQFDFAYMKKPVLYYQPKELPPQYTEGVYQYETMGFGPIIDDYEEIIKALCESIENGCRMEEKYIERVEDFFAYTDHSNCKRIMEEMLG